MAAEVSKRLTDNVKDFLSDETVQGALLGGAGGAGLGLINTDAELEKLAPYITAGTLAGGLGGNALKTKREREDTGGPSPNRWAQLGLLLAGAYLGSKGGGKLSSMGWVDDAARAKLIGGAVGGTAGASTPYLF